MLSVSQMLMQVFSFGSRDINHVVQNHEAMRHLCPFSTNSIYSVSCFLLLWFCYQFFVGSCDVFTDIRQPFVIDTPPLCKWSCLEGHKTAFANNSANERRLWSWWIYVLYTVAIYHLLWTITWLKQMEVQLWSCLHVRLYRWVSTRKA